MSENELLLNRLCALVGAETFDKIVAEFAGERIYFSFNRCDNQKRNEQIKKAYYQNGEKVETIAYEYDLTYSQVRRIING